MTSSAVTLPAPPALLADLTVQAEGQPVSMQLRSVETWQGRVLDEDVSAHRDPTSTQLRPSLTKGEATVHWLVGYRLSAHDHPGDTLVTCALLLQVSEPSQPLRALWYEDHQEVPTTLFIGGGKLSPGVQGGAAKVDLRVKEVDYGDELAISGLIRGF